VRKVLIVCLFLVACATSQGGGQAKAETIALRIEAAEKVLTDPKATPEQKDKARADLSHAARDARELGKQNDATHKVNSELMQQVEKLKPYRNYLIGAGIALALFIVYRLKS